jgi:hypothetical protein
MLFDSWNIEIQEPAKEEPKTESKRRLRERHG